VSFTSTQLEKNEDIKVLIRNPKKDSHYNGQKKKDKQRSTKNRKVKIKQHKLH
jgi:hypothetical protein